MQTGSHENIIGSSISNITAVTMENNKLIPSVINDE